MRWHNFLTPWFLALALWCSFAHAEKTALEEGFTSLFDGKSLTGWEGNPELWSVSEGAITGTSTDAKPIKHNEFLIWKDEVGDFTLRLQFRISDVQGANSGIQYRSQRVPDAGKWVVGGYQADIDQTNRYMGILYDERGRGVLAERGEKVVLRAGADEEDFKRDVVGSVGDAAELVRDIQPGEWVDYEVSAQGNHLVQKLNGRTTADVTDEDKAHAEARGILALQLHSGPAMKIQFRNIRIRHGAPPK